MNQRELKLFSALLEQLEQVDDMLTDWFFYERPFLRYEVEKPEEPEEELEKRREKIIEEMQRLTKR